MIVPPSFLFQYQLSVPRVEGLPKKKGKSLLLADAARVFVPSVLNEGTTGLELKLGWNPDGLAIEIAVRGKKEELAGRRHELAFEEGSFPRQSL